MLDEASSDQSRHSRAAFTAHVLLKSEHSINVLSLPRRSVATPYTMNQLLALSTAPLVLAFCCSFANDARAYTVETQITAGCHERITADALRSARTSLATAKPLDKSGDDDAILQDLPFHVPDDLTDLGGMTLLVGVRDNDLKGLAPRSLTTIMRQRVHEFTEERLRKRGLNLAC